MAWEFYIAKLNTKYGKRYGPFLTCLRKKEIQLFSTCFAKYPVPRKHNFNFSILKTKTIEKYARYYQGRC